MKDRIFIIWSGSKDVGMSIRSRLENKKYKCTIGGNSDNDSAFASVGDTVIQQMKNCNQAIVIFQNKEDGSVSNNLFFELGYVMAMYGTVKVHCVKRADEKVVLPSDFDNSFVKPIKCDSDKQFADGIIDYFLERQKMSINENKMMLINNRYRIHDIIESHFSDKGSKCSDYELAQYLLFYMQAANMFNDEDKVYDEMMKFKGRYQTYFSDELRISVNVCLSFLRMWGEIRTSEEGDVYLEFTDFRVFKDSHRQSLSLLSDSEDDSFANWCRVFIAEQLAYSFELYAANPALSEEKAVKYMKGSEKWAHRTLEYLDILDDSEAVVENNDRVGLVSLFYAYVYGNLYNVSKKLGDGREYEWLIKTNNERISLKDNFQYGGLDSKVYNTIIMEYYLALLESMDFNDKIDMDEDDMESYLDEIREYLDGSQKKSDLGKYIGRVEYLFRKQKNRLNL